MYSKELRFKIEFMGPFIIAFFFSSFGIYYTYEQNFLGCYACHVVLELTWQFLFKGPTLYLIFPVIVIVIVISAMFTFYFCSKLQDKHLENLMIMTMTGKTRYNAPP